jgi:hypothetical protein
MVENKKTYFFIFIILKDEVRQTPIYLVKQMLQGFLYSLMTLVYSKCLKMGAVFGIKAIKNLFLGEILTLTGLALLP